MDCQKHNTLSSSGSVFESEAVCLANRLGMGGKERAVKEESEVSVRSSWMNNCSIC